MLKPGPHRFVAARSRAIVVVHAPGHRFRAAGAGLAGDVELEVDRVVSARTTFELAELDAGDPLKNHELRKFLGLDRRPIATGELEGGARLVAGARGALSGEGTIVVGIGSRSMRAPIRFAAELPRVTARFELSFTGLGFERPKLLFLKVRDRIELELEAELQPA